MWLFWAGRRKQHFRKEGQHALMDTTTTDRTNQPTKNACDSRGERRTKE